jgi:hypothetical protein
MFQRHFEAFGTKIDPKRQIKRYFVETEAKTLKRIETIVVGAIWSLVGPKSRKPSPQSVLCVFGCSC